MKTLLAVLLLVFSSWLLAQDTDTAAAAPGDDAEVRDPLEVFDEITVVGERNFISIRNQIYRAEEDLYRLFNELNTSDDFNIVCRQRKRNSHIGRRECEPAFLTDARRTNALTALADLRTFSLDDGLDASAPSASLGGGNSMFSQGLELLQSETELSYWQGGLYEVIQMEMLRLATENPEFLEALMRVGKLKSVLQDERMRRFGIP